MWILLLQFFLFELWTFPISIYFALLEDEVGWGLIIACWGRQSSKFNLVDLLTCCLQFILLGTVFLIEFLIFVSVPTVGRWPFRRPPRWPCTYHSSWSSVTRTTGTYLHIHCTFSGISNLILEYGFSLRSVSERECLLNWKNAAFGIYQ